MEILKRAKGDSGEIVSFSESESSIKEEVDKRTARAGYTTKLGEPTYGTKIQGLAYLPWSREKLNVWPRDSEGNLIDDT